MIVDYTQVAFWMVVIGGLALFLYGITSISSVLKRTAGKKLRNIIDKFSSTRLGGILVGAGFTAAIQSSGATSALAIGLVRAGVMTLIQAIPIIIGANIGTTITAFIVSIPVMQYMPVFLLIGSVIVMLATRKKWINIGDLCFAVGLIFFGLWIMQMQLEYLAKDETFIGFFTFLTNYPWLGLLIGAVATALLQSSSAVVGIVQGIYAASIIAYMQGSVTVGVSLFGVLPVVFGSNIGSTSTAIIASIGGSKDSKRVAFFHFLFNFIGAFLFMGLLYAFKPLIENSYTWSMDPKLQLALSHLIFNLTVALIFFPFITLIAKLIQKIIPGQDRRSAIKTVEELDKGILRKFPAEGISLAKKQTVVMFGYTKTMFETIINYLDKPNNEDGTFVHDLEANVDGIDRNLNEYLLSVDKGELNSDDIAALGRVMKGCKDIERIGDYAENLIDFFENANEKKNKIPSAAKQVFLDASKTCIDMIDETIQVFDAEDKDKALEVIQKRRDEIALLDDKISSYFDTVNVSSLENDGKVQYIDLVFVDIVNCYQRVMSHCSNVAKLYNTDKQYHLSKSEQEHFKDLSERY